MKPPVPKHEARIFIGAMMTADAPSYSIEEVENEMKRIVEAEANARPAKLDPQAVWDRFNKRT